MIEVAVEAAEAFVRALEEAVAAPTLVKPLLLAQE